MKLSVVIPIFNEEKTIERIVDEVLGEQTPKEIIIIDDGSTDGTWSIIQKSKSIALRSKNQNYNEKLKIIRNEKNKGKGYSVRKGIQEATGDVLIIQDADLEYNPNDYSRLLEPILERKTEVVYGTRLKELKFRLFGKNKTPMPLHYLVNRFLSFLTNVLYGLRLTDMETCYKMMTRKVYEQLELKSNRFDIEPEITAKIAKKGYKIIEIPISTKPRNYNEGKKIRAKDALIAVLTLVKYRVNI